MEAMRQSWTDDRLDDLNGKVDSLRLETRTEFKAVRGELKEEFAAVRGEMKAEFASVRGELKEEFASVRGEMKAGFDKIDDRFDKIDDRLYAMQRLMIQFCGVAIATLLGLIATQV